MSQTESSEHIEITHNHVRVVVNLLKQGKIKTRDLSNLDIFHDPNCALLTRRGRCDCNPRVTVGGEPIQ